MNFLFKKNLKKMNFLLIILLTFAIIYILLTLLTYIFQRNLLYHPSENNYSDTQLTVPIEKVIITTDDNIKLSSWYHKKNVKGYKTILFLHGNAGSLKNRNHKINHFKNLDINFLIVAWRGFSGNKGQPSEKGLYQDARSAVKWLKSKNVMEKDIIIYGESLGTAIAVEIAQHTNFAGIVLESPFTSMIELGKEKYPFLPVKILLKDKYESLKKIKNINIPILIMHGMRDNLVPFYMGKKMYEEANIPKHSYFSKHDDHMMSYDKNLLNNLKNFIIGLN
jgi:hypothetical protein